MIERKLTKISRKAQQITGLFVNTIEIAPPTKALNGNNFWAAWITVREEYDIISDGNTLEKCLDNLFDKLVKYEYGDL